MPATPACPAPRDVRPLLLGGRQTFFLKLMPAPVKNRESIPVSTRTPRSVISRAANAASVMSGCAAIVANSQPRWGWTFEGPMPPGAHTAPLARLLETTEPPDRRRFTDAKPARRCPPTQPGADHGVNHTVS